jgi:class 3 adenylate cyclase
LAGATDIDGILRDAAWRNERIINRFRIGYCLLMGVPSTVFNLATGHGIPVGNWGFLVWLVIALAAEVVLRRSYHPALALGLTTADIVLQEVSLYLFALTLSPESKEFLPALYGIGISGLVMAGMSMARFSVPIAAWSVALSWGLFVFLVTRVRPFDVGYIFEGILYLFFFGLLWLNARRFRELPLRMRERDAFARFLPVPAIERIVKNPASLNLGGEEQDATVLFSDLRGFTTLSAGLPPATVVRLLNEYFKEMVEEVFAHQGTLDKFIGDGLCAVFSPPLSAQEQAQAALRCALGMVKRLEKLNAGWAARGEPQLKLGVGIHCGKLVAGNIGSPRRMEYTHIGDAVNTCSRIEGMTKELGAPVLASQAVVQRAGAMGEVATRELPAVTVRGKSDSLVLCAVTSS